MWVGVSGRFFFRAVLNASYPEPVPASRKTQVKFHVVQVKGWSPGKHVWPGACSSREAACCPKTSGFLLVFGSKWFGSFLAKARTSSTTQKMASKSSFARCQKSTSSEWRKSEKGSMTRSTRDMERSDPYLSIPFRSWQESWCALSWPEEFYCRPFRCREHGWVGGTLGGSPDSDGFMASHWPWIFTEWRCNWVRFAQMRIRNVCLDAGVSSTKMFVHFSKKDWTLLDSLNISIWNAPDLFIAPAQGSCYSYQAASGSRCGKNAKDGEW